MKNLSALLLLSISTFSLNAFAVNDDDAMASYECYSKHITLKIIDNHKTHQSYIKIRHISGLFSVALRDQNWTLPLQFETSLDPNFTATPLKILGEAEKSTLFSSPGLYLKVDQSPHQNDLNADLPAVLHFEKVNHGKSIKLTCKQQIFG